MTDKVTQAEGLVEELERYKFVNCNYVSITRDLYDRVRTALSSQKPAQIAPQIVEAMAMRLYSNDGGSDDDWKDEDYSVKSSYRSLAQDLCTLAYQTDAPEAQAKGLVAELLAADRDWYIPGEHPILSAAADRWIKEARPLLARAATALSEAQLSNSQSRR